jgi:Mor family transcriptional regulator
MRLRWTDELLSEIRQLLGENKTVADVAKHFNVTPGTIYEVCRRRNLTPPRVTNKWTPNNRRKLCRQRELGWSIKSISEYWNITPVGIYNVIDRYGLAKQKRREIFAKELEVIYDLRVNRQLSYGAIAIKLGSDKWTNHRVKNAYAYYARRARLYGQGPWAGRVIPNNGQTN